MTSRKEEDTLIWRRKLWIALCGGRARFGRGFGPVVRQTTWMNEFCITVAFTLVHNCWNFMAFASTINSSHTHPCRLKHTTFVDSKVVPGQAVMARTGNRGAASHIFSFCTKWRWEVNLRFGSFVPGRETRYTMSRKLSGTKNLSGRFGAGKISISCVDRLAGGLVTVPSTVSRLRWSIVLLPVFCKYSAQWLQCSEVGLFSCSALRTVLYGY
jgi:hypothetical protein